MTNEQQAEEQGPRAGDDVPRWLLAAAGALIVAVIGVGGLVWLTWESQASRNDAGMSEIEPFEKAVEFNSTDVEARVNLGYAYQQYERYQEAIRTYDEALSQDPGNLGALYNRGVCLIALEQYEDGEEALQEVLRIAPAHLLAAKTLGEYYRTTEQYSKIPDAVAPAAMANPEMADLHALLGLALEKSGLMNDAAVEYRRALATAPDLPLALEGMARVGEAAK